MAINKLNNKVKDTFVIFNKKSNEFNNAVQVYKNKINEYKRKVIILKRKIDELHRINNNFNNYIGNNSVQLENKNIIHSLNKIHLNENARKNRKNYLNIDHNLKGSKRRFYENYKKIIPNFKKTKYWFDIDIKNNILYKILLFK